MTSFEHFSKQVFRTAEQGFLGDKNVSMEELMSILADPNASKSFKLANTLAFIRGVLPKRLRDKLKNKLYDSEALPIHTDTYEFKGTMGAGGQNDVYLLESSDPDLPSLVLKISIREGSNETLTAQAHQFKKDARVIAERYAAVPNLISPEHYFITKSPKTNQENVIGAVQEFMGRNLKDIFSEVRREELVELLKEPAFREQFVKFAEITCDTWEREGKVIDIMGKENVAIVEMPDGSVRLLVIDPHDMLIQQEPNSLSEVKRRIAYLKEVSNDVATDNQKAA